jgi:hypothetical protein
MTHKILCITNGYIPSVVLGMLLPVIDLVKNKKIAASIIDLRFTSNHSLIKKIKEVELVYVCRLTLPSEELVLRICKALSVPILYEIDDNFFQIPTTTEVGRVHKNPINLAIHKNFIKYATKTRVYSRQMVKQVEMIGGYPTLYKTYVDLSLFPLIGKDKKKSELIKIGYPTGRLDDPLIKEIICGTIRSLGKIYGSNIQFHLWSRDFPIDIIESSNVLIHKPIQDYKAYVAYIAKLDLDIGLAPLIDHIFYHSKTENKFREFGALNIAGVYSNCAPYSDIVENKKLGLLASFSIDSWVESIQWLIENPLQREEISSNARNFISENYKFSNYVDNLYLSITNAISKNKSLCNVKTFEVNLKKYASINITLLSQFLNLKNEKNIYLGHYKALGGLFSFVDIVFTNGPHYNKLNTLIIDTLDDDIDVNYIILSYQCLDFSFLNNKKLIEILRLIDKNSIRDKFMLFNISQKEIILEFHDSADVMKIYFMDFDLKNSFNESPFEVLYNFISHINYLDIYSQYFYKNRLNSYIFKFKFIILRCYQYLYYKIKIEI